MILKFKAVGTSLVRDYEAMEAGIRRFIGRKTVKLDNGQIAYEPTDEPTEKSFYSPYRGEYILECKAGALEPADEYTAKVCGVQWSKE